MCDGVFNILHMQGHAHASLLVDIAMSLGQQEQTYQPSPIVVITQLIHLHVLTVQP